MKTKVVWSLFLIFGLALLFSACSGLQKPVVLETKKTNVVHVTMMDYTFQPNNLQAYRGETIVFRLDNVSSGVQNFTVQDPESMTLQSVDVAPGKTSEVRLNLAKSGIYTFYCNKFLHSTMGMKGQIVVVTTG